MLNNLKQTGKALSQEINRAWDNLAEGWRELLSRSSHALTPFTRHKAGDAQGDGLATLPRWGLVSGELEETARDVVVRVELPGMDKADCRITIEGNLLRLSGEKRFEREAHDSTYHVMERAYGAFERVIPLPRSVDVDKAEASFRNGVLTVRLPKGVSDKARAIQVS